MAERKPADLYDYIIIHKLEDGKQRRFVGELLHIHDDGIFILLKKIMEQESWLALTKEEEDLLAAQFEEGEQENA